MQVNSINISAEQIREFCLHHRIRKFMLFGSVLQGDLRPTSDIDVLVEFEPGYTPGLEFITLQQELESIFGRPVDLNTPGFLSRHMRQAVMAGAKVIYERA